MEAGLLLGDERPGTDQRHLAPDDIDELGELVEAGPAEEAAEGEHPGVLADLEEGPVDFVAVGEGAPLVLGPVPHRPELVHGERPAVASDPVLAEEDPAPGTTT